MKSPFLYDVAFSFLAEDESLAQRLGRMLSERYAVFVYSERQKELAGRDGLEQFSAVFRTHSRMCVILYQAGWGNTKWTRVEETAIKERAFDEGWEFLLVVSLDGSAPPPWLPRTKIWLGLERFGVDAAVGVIDARIQESGGSAKEETARERAERLKNESEQEAKRRAMLDSSVGVALAQAELKELASYLETEVAAIAANGIPIEFRHARDHVMYVRSPRRSVTFGWSQQFSNSLQYAGLLIRVLSGVYHLDGLGEGPPELSRVQVHFDVDSGGRPGWREDAAPQLLSSKALAEKYLKMVVDGTYDPHLDGDYDDYG